MSEREKYFRAFCILGEVFGYVGMGLQSAKCARGFVYFSGCIMKPEGDGGCWLLFSRNPYKWRKEARSAWSAFLQQKTWIPVGGGRFIAVPMITASCHDVAEIAIRLEEEGLTDYGFVEELRA